MKIWCIDYGDFGVALIEGIDRAKKSQVTKFVDRHGDHACQHVAYDTHDLEKFQAHMRDLGGSARGGTLVRNDGFGILKQMFARGYSEGDAAEATFPEYVQRPHARRRRRGAHHLRRGDRPRLLRPDRGRRCRRRRGSVLRLHQDADRLARPDPSALTPVLGTFGPADKVCRLSPEKPIARYVRLCDNSSARNDTDNTRPCCGRNGLQ